MLKRRSRNILGGQFAGKEYPYARGYGASPTARAFVAGSSQALTVANPVIIPYPASMMIWFYDAVGSNVSCLISAALAASAVEYGSINVNGSQKVTGEVRGGGAFANPVSATSYPLNAWNNAILIFNSAGGAKDIYLNGGGKGSDSTTVNIASWDQFAIGQRCSSAAVYGTMAALAQATCWNIALSAAEISALTTPVEYNGVIGYPSARMVRPEAIRGHWPIFGNGSPELDQEGRGLDLTLVNTPAKAAFQPPIIYPPGFVWSSAS